jgi:hypothetical protein
VQYRGTSKVAKLSLLQTHALLSADDNTLAAGGSGYVVVFTLVRRARLTIAVATHRAATVQTDSVALASDTVALTGAGRRGRAVAAGARDLRRRGAARRVGDGRANRRGRADVLIVVVTNGGAREAGGELVDGWRSNDVVFEDVPGLGWVEGLGRLDLRDAQGTALWYVGGGALGLAGRVLAGVLAAATAAGGLAGLAGLAGNVQNVEGSASGRLDSGSLGLIVRHTVAIDDVVVPVSLAGLQSRSLELECSFPAALARVTILCEGELSGVVVPRAKQVDGLGTGIAKSEAELNSRHDSYYCRLNYANEKKSSIWFVR